jgi:hypothetical protein
MKVNRSNDAGAMRGRQGDVVVRFGLQALCRGTENWRDNLRIARAAVRCSE